MPDHNQFTWRITSSRGELRAVVRHFSSHHGKLLSQGKLVGYESLKRINSRGRLVLNIVDAAGNTHAPGAAVLVCKDFYAERSRSKICETYFFAHARDSRLLPPTGAHAIPFDSLYVIVEAPV
jgi:hypothetical protein